MQDKNTAMGSLLFPSNFQKKLKVKMTNKDCP